MDELMKRYNIKEKDKFNLCLKTEDKHLLMGCPFYFKDGKLFDANNDEHRLKPFGVLEAMYCGDYIVELKEV